MDKKIRIVFDVRLGKPVKEASELYEVSPATIRRWVKDYRRPSREVIDDLIAEQIVDLLRGGVKGSEFSGIVAALKLVGEDAADNLMELLESLAAVPAESAELDIDAGTEPAEPEEPSTEEPDA